MTELSRTEQKVLSLFGTNRNEDGRVQVWTIPECKAAWSLSKRGLVGCEISQLFTHSFDRGPYGRWQGGMTIKQSVAVNIILTQRGEYVVSVQK